MKFLRTLAVSLPIVVVACGGSTKPAADPSLAKAEVPAAKSDAAAKPDDAAKADDAAKPGKDAPKGPLKFASFPGPNVAPPKGSPVWVVAPIQNSAWTELLGFFLAESKGVEGNTTIVKGVHDDVYVPGAFAAPTTNGTYKKGQLVLVASDVSLIVGSHYGRVAEIENDDATPRYKVIFRFADSTMDATVDATSILPLTDKLSFGAPAAFKDGERWTTAMYVGPGAEKGKSWVITWGSHLEQHGDVKPLVVTKGYKKGDKVWASRYSDLEPATIVESVDDGLRYKVKTADGKEDTVDATGVTSPL